MADFDYIGINVSAAQLERIASMGINTEQVTENSGNDEIPTSKAVYEGIKGSVEDNYSASSEKAQSGIAVGIAIENSVDKIRYFSDSHEITNVQEALDELFEGGAASPNSEQVSHSLQILGESENVKEALDTVENFIMDIDANVIPNIDGRISANASRLDVLESQIGTSGGGSWEKIADITIPEGFSSYNYAITEATYPDIARITDFYIEMSVPTTSELISGALQVQAKQADVNFYTNIARFETWNHANYIMKGALFSKLFGNKRHNQYYGFGANAAASFANNSLLNGLNVGYFKEINIAISDVTKILPAGMTIKIMGCKV